jgi:transposase-like protein
MANAQQRLKEIAAQEQALADEKKKLLDASKDADLETVKQLCKQHGFTATQLRSVLKKKGKSRATGDAAAKKPAAKKAPAKKAAAKK